jgi:cytochrome c oxidase assembly factor CtaG
MRWGLILGGALFVVSLISWALKLEQTKSTWAMELLKFVVILPAILYTGMRNGRLTGPDGYSYNRAVGYVFATMMFAGIVYGVGKFLMVNFIAREYFDAINAEGAALIEQMYQGTPMAQYSDMAIRMQTNPIVLIVRAVFELAIKGGFLGLILGAFFKKTPDVFADQPAHSCSVSKNE